MKRTAIALFAVLLMSAALVSAAVAAPDSCRNPDHPNCTTTTEATEPPVTTTDAPDIPLCETVTYLSGSRSAGMTCLWTPERGSGATPTAGRVTVETTSGELSDLVIWVRDAEPGDICVLEQLHRPGAGNFAASFPLTALFESYWDEPTHWCRRFDPAMGVRDDPNGAPLHLEVSFQTKRGAAVVVALDPQQDPAPAP